MNHCLEFVNWRRITFLVTRRLPPRINSFDWAISVASFLRRKKNLLNPNRVTIWGIWPTIQQLLQIASSQKNLKTNYTGRVYWRHWIGRYKFAIWISQICKQKRTAIRWIPSGATVLGLLRLHLHRCWTAEAFCHHRQWCQWVCFLLLCLRRRLHRQEEFLLFPSHRRPILVYSCITTVPRIARRAKKRSNSFGAKLEKTNFRLLKALLYGMNSKRFL